MQGKEPLGAARTSRGARRARKAWPPTGPFAPPARDAAGARGADRRGLRPRPAPDPRHLRRDDDPAARGLGRPGSGGRGCRSDCCDRAHELRRAPGAGASGGRGRRRGRRRRADRAGRLLGSVGRGRVRRRRDPLGDRGRSPSFAASSSARARSTFAPSSERSASSRCSACCSRSCTWRSPTRRHTEFFTGVARSALERLPLLQLHDPHDDRLRQPGPGRNGRASPSRSSRCSSARSSSSRSSPGSSAFGAPAQQRPRRTAPTPDQVGAASPVGTVNPSPSCPRWPPLACCSAFPKGEPQLGRILAGR